MKEYQFEYTSTWVPLFVILSCIAVFISSTFLWFYLNFTLFLGIPFSLGLSFLLFRVLKKIAVHKCKARLDDDSLSLELGNNKIVIKLSDMVSYKFYDGKNGIVLSLKTNSNKYRITANNNFCNTDDFNSFWVDTLAQLETLKKQKNLGFTKESSIYATKGMFYFLIIATVVYIVSLFIEAIGSFRIAIGIGGGLFLFIEWMGYLIVNNKK